MTTSPFSLSYFTFCGNGRGGGGSDGHVVVGVVLLPQLLAQIMHQSTFYHR
jgi:hypothetical protein